MQLIRKTVSSVSVDESLPRKEVLLLNASEESIGLITWQRATSLLFSGKAHPPYNFDYYFRLSTTSGDFDLPTAIILAKYVRIPRRIMPLTRKNVLKRDEGMCQYCSTPLGMDTITVDHVHPTSKGGRNEWRNVVAACQPCNAKKGNRLLSECRDINLSRKPWVPTNYNILQPSPKDSLLGWDRWILKPATRG